MTGFAIKMLHLHHGTQQTHYAPRPKTDFRRALTLVEYRATVFGKTEALFALIAQKSNRGRTLSFEDIKHYQKIIKILCETDRIMATIEMDL
jgi:hypothetical protein